MYRATNIRLAEISRRKTTRYFWVARRSPKIWSFRRPGFSRLYPEQDHPLERSQTLNDNKSRKCSAYNEPHFRHGHKYYCALSCKPVDFPEPVLHIFISFRKVKTHCHRFKKHERT